ncbi:MAG: F0F1 ATP synthase subunit A [Coriobacteriia bacterium]|nr:F0F1 ATP synthase subunit A [Coriobacteriia bacterium]MCL2745864.1 F0F1 ATP synthase subunit A [Coriobacteriia bacterium]MCL2870289.1 F0F1 ATP synthase subunit A [Coriobacteriia bacterium]
MNALLKIGRVDELGNYVSGLARPVTDPMAVLGGEVDYMVEKKIAMTWDGYQMGATELAISTNTVGFILTAIFVALLCFFLARRMTLVPKGAGMNFFELIVEFVRNNIASLIHHDKRKYEPFLLTIFFFILIANFSGLIPNTGRLFATATIGATASLAIVVYIYFNYVGIREKGGWNYIKGIVPHGVPGVLAPVIWAIEVLSMLLRPISLALRLWANMYAGHIMLGIFALLTGLFATATLDGSGGAWIAASPAWALLLAVVYLIEILICIIAAFVFTLLTAVYIDGAIADH